MQRSWALRFGLTSGHEKAAFVKARARDREVAQRSSLGSSVASLDRRGGWRLGARSSTHLLGELFCNRRLCNTLQTARNRRGHTETVNNGRLAFSRLCCLAPHPSSSLRFSLPSCATPPKESYAPPTSRNPEVELHRPHLSSTCTHTCTHDPRGDPAAHLTTYEITAGCR